MFAPAGRIRASISARQRTGAFTQATFVMLVAKPITIAVSNEHISSGGARMGRQQETSALFSLQELMRLEAERVEAELRARAARERAEAEARSEQERALREAEQRKQRERLERERALEENQRAESARLAALREAEIEKARLEAEHAARLAARAAEHEHERQLAALRGARTKKRTRYALLALLLSATAAASVAVMVMQTANARVERAERALTEVEQSGRRSVHDMERRYEQANLRIRELEANLAEQRSRPLVSTPSASSVKGSSTPPARGRIPPARPPQRDAPCPCPPGDPMCPCL